MCERLISNECLDLHVDVATFDWCFGIDVGSSDVASATQKVVFLAKIVCRLISLICLQTS